LIFSRFRLSRFDICRRRCRRRHARLPHTVQPAAIFIFFRYDIFASAFAISAAAAMFSLAVACDAIDITLMLMPPIAAATPR